MHQVQNPHLPELSQGTSGHTSPDSMTLMAPGTASTPTPRTASLGSTNQTPGPLSPSVQVEARRVQGPCATFTEGPSVLRENLLLAHP